MKYRLKTLVNRPSGSFIALPEIQPSLRFEKELLAAIRRLLKVIRQQVYAEILPMAIAERAAMKRALTGDAQSHWDMLRAITNAMSRTVSQTVSKILSLEAGEHTKKWLRTTKKAIGVDLAAVVREEDLTELLEQAATRNASLITNIGEQTVNRIQQTVTQAVLSGTPVKDLKARLIEDFGFADKRAQLIARDQIAKLNADLNRFRHQEAGCEKYQWRTSRDERVRSRHKALHGKIYEYGKPTGAEQGLPPGQPIRCRCVAIAIVEF